MTIHHLDNFCLFQCLYHPYQIVLFCFAIYFCLIYLILKEIFVFQTYLCLLEEYSNKMVCILEFHANRCYHTTFYPDFWFMNWNSKTSLKITYLQIIFMDWFNYFIYDLLKRHQPSHLTYYYENFYMLTVICRSNFIKIYWYFYISYHLSFVKIVDWLN